MNRIRHTIPIILLLFTFTVVTAQQSSDSRSVHAYAVIDKVSPSIELKWQGTPNETDYVIHRRTFGSEDWGTAIATKAASDRNYIDTDVYIGEVYEYRITKNTTTTDPYRPGGLGIRGYSYICGSIDKPAIHNRGTLWLLITRLINNSLSSEIETLKQDLAMDGWNVYTEIVNPSAKVSDVKTLIDLKHATTGCDALYLLGNVPVPYSGLYCEDDYYYYPPDGHGPNDGYKHCGAWPADVYYGVIDGAWTDDGSSTTGERSANQNNIGDGKFDQQRIPGKIEIAIGRVDLSKLTLFSKTEVELTRQYLNKVHAYKMGNTFFINKAVIENNFASFDEGFSSGARRDFTALLGQGNLLFQDLFETTDTQDYLLSYTCGGGSYTSCSGVGNSDDFITKNGALFNHSFGSFFGDFDIENNFLRSFLATEKMGLAVMWSGRPKWVTHSLAIGESYGDIALRSQRNKEDDYDCNFYQNTAHIGLLGDPSLRHHILKPAKDLVVTANEERSEATITWTASDEPFPNGYFIYRSHKGSGGYVLLNPTLTTALTYTDKEPYNGTNHYMVRTAKTITTGSGSYTALSLGNMVKITGMEGVLANIGEAHNTTFKVYPTVVSQNFTVEILLGQAETTYRIVNMQGAVVQEGSLTGKKSTIKANQLTNGMYLVRIGNKTHRIIKH